MPRKKVNPVEEPEQVNDMEMEPQVPEETAEGLEQPPTDDLQEDTPLPAVGEETPPNELPNQDADVPGAELPREGLDTGPGEETAGPPEPPFPEEAGAVSECPPLEEEDTSAEPSAMKPFRMEHSDPPLPPSDP